MVCHVFLVFSLCRVISWCVGSYYVTSYHFVPCHGCVGHALSFLSFSMMPQSVMFCHVMSHHIISCQVTCVHVMFCSINPDNYRSWPVDDWTHIIVKVRYLYVTVKVGRFLDKGLCEFVGHGGSVETRVSGMTSTGITFMSPPCPQYSQHPGPVTAVATARSNHCRRFSCCCG